MDPSKGTEQGLKQELIIIIILCDFLESKKDAVAHSAPHLAYAYKSLYAMVLGIIEARVKDEWNLSGRIWPHTPEFTGEDSVYPQVT